MPSTKANGRFVLPQVKPVNFSLTDGTDIPPPPASPIEEKAPAPLVTKTLEEVNPTASKLNGSATPNGAATRKHPDEPLSPASSKRPSSIRRFLSRKSLNSIYIDGTSSSREDLGRSSTVTRPDSALSFSPSGNGAKRQKSGSWFRKFSGKRTSIVMEENMDIGQQKKKQPPPPTLPELYQLKAKIGNNDEGSLGGEDLFKNIK